jgi:hypothetical protein
MESYFEPDFSSVHVLACSTSMCLFPNIPWPCELGENRGNIGCESTWLEIQFIYFLFFLKGDTHFWTSYFLLLFRIYKIVTVESCNMKIWVNTPAVQQLGLWHFRPTSCKVLVQYPWIAGALMVQAMPWRCITTDVAISVERCASETRDFGANARKLGIWRRVWDV